MSSQNTLKHQIVAAIFDQLPSDQRPPKTIDKMVFSWFETGRQGNSLRLTLEGKRYFDIACIESYSYPIFDRDVNTLLNTKYLDDYWINKFTLSCGRFLRCPYHIGDQKVTVYDGKVAMMIGLYGGTLIDYLISQEQIYDRQKEQGYSNTEDGI